MFVVSPTRYVTPHAGHAARQPLRLPLRYAHRGPLHPGHYGTGLPRPSMRCTTRAVFATLTCTTPARLKGRATRPVTTHPPRVTSFAYDGARPMCSLRSKVARRRRRASWKRRRSSARPLRLSVHRRWWARSPPRPGSAKPRVGAPVCRRSYAAASPPQRRIMAHIMRSFTPSPGPRGRGPRLGVHTLGLPGASPRWNRKRSVPLALPGRGCVVGDAGNDRAEQRRRIV
jgi:hypothetical protein